MELKTWKISFRKGWDKHFVKFDKSVKELVLKKFDQMKQPLQSRGLYSSRYKIEEVGQCRIAFEEDAETKTKNIHFVGNHKQYEKWYKSL